MAARQHLIQSTPQFPFQSLSVSAAASRTASRAAMVALTAALLTTHLSGCLPVVATSAVVGTLAATDRRTVGAQTEDQGIELKAAYQFSQRFGDRVHINTTSYNRKVLLAGEVPDAATRADAEAIVSRLENVGEVVNELEVAGNSSLSSRSSDTLITGRVKTSMARAEDIYFNAFKVVTERGTVYLMGRVTQREADRATDIARSTPGVQKVVRVFDYISEEELARMQSTPAPATSGTTAK